MHSIFVSSLFNEIFADLLVPSFSSLTLVKAIVPALAKEYSQPCLGLDGNSSSSRPLYHIFVPLTDPLQHR